MADYPFDGLDGVLEELLAGAPEEALEGLVNVDLLQSLELGGAGYMDSISGMDSFGIPQSGIAEALESLEGWPLGELTVTEVPLPELTGLGDGVEEGGELVSGFDEALSENELVLDHGLSEMGETLGAQTNFGGLGVELVHGNPENAVWNYTPQFYSDTCAVMCQADIIEDLTGHPVPEDFAREIAIREGIYHPGGGTAPRDVGKLLEVFGIPTTQQEGQTIEDLKEALSNGQEIIVGLDAEEIWNPGAIGNDLSLNELFGYPDSGHAVRVTGIIENTESGVTEVIINDPGKPDGVANRVLVDDFLDAWDDCDNFACYTLPRDGAEDFASRIGEGLEGTSLGAGEGAGNLGEADESLFCSAWLYGERSEWPQ